MNVTRLMSESILGTYNVEYKMINNIWSEDYINGNKKCKDRSKS